MLRTYMYSIIKLINQHILIRIKNYLDIISKNIC